MELASGIDALYLSGRGELLAETLERFEERRGCAEDLNLAAPVDVGPLTFSIAPMAGACTATASITPSAGSGRLLAPTSQRSESSLVPSSFTPSDQPRP